MANRTTKQIEADKIDLQLDRLARQLDGYGWTECWSLIRRARVEVRERMRDGLPATIYRPAIVVGDSRTGVTQKYDGPYYVIRWLLRQYRRRLG